LTTEPAATATTPGLARNAFHLGVGQVVTTAAAMMLSAAIARTLGAAEFGLLYLLTSFATFAYVFVDWGHGPYVTREIARNHERSGDLMGSVLVVRAITTVLMCGLIVTLTWALGYDLRTRMLAATLVLAWLPQYLGLSYGWAFRGWERMEYDALVQVVLKITTLVMALVVLGLGGRLLALILVYGAAGVVTLVVAMTLYRRLHFPALRFSKSTATELVRDGAPMLAMSLAVAVQPYIDANLLYKLTPTHVVGWYGAAWTIASTLVAPASILGATMYPRLSRVSGDPDQFRLALRTGFRPLLLIGVLGAAGAYLFAGFAIELIYGGEKFGAAADIIRGFTPALLLIYMDMLFGYAILAVGRAGALAKAKIIAILVTTAVEIVLIVFFQNRFANGGIGAVLAMTSGELVMVSAAVLLLREFLDRGMMIDFIRALVCGGATVLILRAVPVPALVAIPLSIAVFGLLCVAIGLLTRADASFISQFRKGRRPTGPDAQ
jgi:O-antigen/teichoic acid export membrane protein